MRSVSLLGMIKCLSSGIGRSIYSNNSKSNALDISFGLPIVADKPII